MFKKKYKILRDPVMLELPDSSGMTIVVHQIQALGDFTIKSSDSSAKQIKRGDLGGYVQTERNLSQFGCCWVFPGAAVIGEAVVRKNATARGTSKDGKVTTFVADSALLSGSSSAIDSEITGKSGLTDYCLVIRSKVGYRGRVGGRVYVCDSTIHDRATLTGEGEFCNSKACGAATIGGQFSISKGATLAGSVTLDGRTSISGRVRIRSGILRDCKVEEKE